MKLDLDGLNIEIHRKRIKNLNLRINAQGEVKISVPLKYPLASIYAYLDEKRSWIEKHHARFKLLDIAKPLKLETGETHFFWGNPYTLIVYTDRQAPCIELQHKTMCFYVTQEMTLLQKQKCLEKWYKHQMEQVLPELIKKWQAMIGVHAETWVIKNMKTRWGSCSLSKKRICLNLRLIHKPLVCLEQVIVHELVHLLEASHNQRFYALMTKFMPEWKEYNKLFV